MADTTSKQDSAAHKDAAEDEDVSLAGCCFMEEPKDFYRPPPVPTTVEYPFTSSSSKRVLKFHLVASHALWAHYLWNGGRHIANMIAAGELDVKGKRVLEFGAGAAVPSVVAALCGAKHVVATDFPEEPLLDVIRRNVAENIEDAAVRSRVAVHGFLWGADPTPLLRSGLDEDTATQQEEEEERGKFDVLLMGDLMANHKALPDLAKSVSQLMRRRGGVGIVAFGHHRPWLAERDLMLFQHLRELGVVCTEVASIATTPMFEQDPGPAEVRGTTHVYKVHWPQ